MKHTKYFFLIILTYLLFSYTGLFSEVIMTEDFESDGDGTRYTVSGGSNDNDSDYFVRTDGTFPSGLPGYTLKSGTWFFAAEDMDTYISEDVVSVIFNDIDISGSTDLSLSGLFASGVQDKYDASDFMDVLVDIDNTGTWTLIGSFRNDGSTYNKRLGLDSDLNGTHNGTLLTSAFTEYSFDIAGTGSLIDIKIELDVDAGSEEAAFDNIALNATGSGGGNITPTITNIAISPSTNITSSTTVSVSADVTDASGLASVNLKWGTETGVYTDSTTMSVSTTPNYSANIPAQAKDTTVYYIVEATDSADPALTTTSTEASYAVLNSAPAITSISITPSTNITSSQAVLVSATITDEDDDTISAELKWGTATGVLSNSITMNGSGSTYTTGSDIPAQENNTTVYYQITATDNNTPTAGATTSDELNYTVEDPLVANFTASSTIIYSGNPTTFTNTTTGGIPNLNFSWDFDDGVTSTDESPIYTYTTTGNYTVTLTVTDNNIRVSSSKTLDVEVKTAPAGATDLFFSEYIEGSSNSKAVEIFNGTGHTVDLTHYSVKIASNANDFSTKLSLPGTLLNGEVYVIANSGSHASILAVTDATGAVAGFDGNDAIGLFKNNTLIDVIGIPAANANQGVAGTTAATSEHTLVRNADVVSPTTNWTTSAGTNTSNSQWTVYTQDEFSYIGSHTFTSTSGTALVSDFVADVTSGNEPLTVNFTNFVSGGSYPYFYSWDFDGDGTEDSTSPHPTFTFTQDGTYNVSLKVLDSSSGNKIELKSSYIIVNAVNIESYYSSITNQTGETLKADLKTLVSTNTSTDYDSSRAQMYSVIDNIDNEITGVYTGIVVNQDHGDGSTPTDIDAEHSYPQSWLSKYETIEEYNIARSDIHHLFPTKRAVNIARSNLPFDNVNDVTNSYNEATGYTSYKGTNIAGEQVFEVADQHKGNTARAMFYMNTRWDLPLEDDGFLPDGTTPVALSINMLPTLLEWCLSDPVDAAEIARNEAIFAYQGNRNPFVNHPEWITSIYGSPQVAAPIISPGSDNHVNSVEVTISSSTAGATIYYTTDGTSPTNGSFIYSNPLNITSSTTVKAFATKTDYDNSIVASQDYIITTGVSGAGDLFFSEYIEGATGNNKAIEIYNGTGSTVDLSNYYVKKGTNGADYSESYKLSDAQQTLGNNKVLTLANSGSDQEILDIAVDNPGVTAYNGDDPLGLFNGTVLIDVIGAVGTDPGVAWPVAGIDDATANKVLVRKASVVVGNTNWTTSAGTDASDSEWIVYPNATYTYLGTHRFAETATSVEPAVGTLYISEISDANTANNRYIELYNNSNSVLSLENIKIRKDLTTDYNLAFTGSYTGERDILPKSYIIISQSADKAALQTGFGVVPDVEVGFLQAASGMGFDESHRWQLIHGTNTKAEIMIDDTDSAVGGTGNTWYPTSPGGSWNNESISGSTPGLGHGDQTLPVTLTSFTSTITYSGLGEPFVSIQWKTEAESGLIGYNILRSEFSNLETAIRTNQEIVGATNSLIGNNYSYVDEQVDLYSTYYYWLESVELSNENETFGPISIRVENNNSNGVTIPYQTTLRGVYPNPFNPTTTVSFYVKNPDRVKIKVYNIKGQEIKELDNNVYQPGFHKLNWNGKDGNGNDCASGIYFFRMETRSENQTIKGILMK